MDINNIDLLSLQTEAMKQDETTKALCIAMSPEFKSVADVIVLCLIKKHLDKLSEEMLDEIASEKNIFWYDPTASKDVKVNIIKNAPQVFRYLGTPYAVEKVVEDYFGDGEVEEWWQYDGQPYHFRIVTTNSEVTGELAERFNKAIENIKRKSTRLDEVIVSLAGTFNTYYGFAVHTCDRVTIRQGGLE